MPNNSRPGRVANFFGRAVDRIVPGNNWNPNAAAGSRLTITPGQAIGTVGSVVGNALIPGSGPVIRSMTHGATTGEGLFGFLAPNAQFVGSPITAMPFVPSFSGGYAPIGPAGLTPVTPDPVAPNQFRVTARRGGPLRFESGQTAPTPTAPLSPMGGGIPNMGGARGMRSWGGAGITGDAARAFMEGIHHAPSTIYTGYGGQRAR